MRLVDADNARECFGGDGVTGAVMQRMFDSLPTIDAVPVVRCAKCKNCEEYKTFPGGLFCPYIKAKVPPDGYCYMGEEGGRP